MKAFDIPTVYKSETISAIKKSRQEDDHLKRDFNPTILDFGKVKIHLARHFGFCYGVENAIETAYAAIQDNPDKQIYLLSEIIHNQYVNQSLLENGVRFIMDTLGNQLISWEDITAADVVIIPAFGTTLEIERILKEKGIEQIYYRSKCPFVEKVWTRVSQIADKGYTVIVHGKPNHEETRATFSHSKSVAASIIIKDLREARLLADFIGNRRPPTDFYALFKGRYSEGFDVTRDLNRIGVVNQTTLLASETQQIADFLQRTIQEHHHLSDDQVAAHFANMRDTLCYATHDNQTAVINMLSLDADLAIVVGGYNSSNTSHLVELCEAKLPTYFISSSDSLLSDTEIEHWDIHRHRLTTSYAYLPSNSLTLHLTSGASCPDILIENVIRRLLSFYELSLNS
ncbi:4-hydroxy-3-methylbut-2-enyl diphosphate reductase [Olivibacter domesticus]|uniref:4-hydroxy-3-methylbut-2-enyl diphosphate reductase n=1 Tax=Olivibacter domesticus TaxID=407022 RepID=A0A1H7UC34_OLID1|nr:4-hydroxy-3-methylbut-2-enyl diphosphate reductase [Olivibacter domesticus]SEL94379.1 4-hydroxy-3-methylbut-2-enyl diphosphate reductase [Olivibacter domesticus]